MSNALRAQLRSLTRTTKGCALWGGHVWLSAGYHVGRGPTVGLRRPGRVQVNHHCEQPALCVERHHCVQDQCCSDTAHQYCVCSTSQQLNKCCAMGCRMLSLQAPDTIGITKGASSGQKLSMWLWFCQPESLLPRGTAACHAAEATATLCCSITSQFVTLGWAIANGQVQCLRHAGGVWKQQNLRTILQSVASIL